MNGFLQRFFGPKGPKRQPVREVTNPLLGALSYDDVSGSWGIDIPLDGYDMRLSVGGEYEPDPALLDQAVAFREQLSEFITQLHRFLNDAAGANPEMASEIRSLKPNEFALWWPKQPRSAMIFFNGPSEERLWHCDYRDGLLEGTLVFDD